MEIHVQKANIYLLKRARGLTFVWRVCSKPKVRIVVSCVSVEKTSSFFSFYLDLEFFTQKLTFRSQVSLKVSSLLVFALISASWSLFRIYDVKTRSPGIQSFESLYSLWKSITGIFIRIREVISFNRDTEHFSPIIFHLSFITFHLSIVLPVTR